MRRFFDISVPRNVAADVSDLEGARVFNVDDLKEVSGALAVRVVHQQCTHGRRSLQHMWLMPSSARVKANKTRNICRKTLQV